MSWASFAVRELQEGREVTVRPRGNSMRPKVESGQEVRLAPYAKGKEPEVNDIVLVRCKGRVYLHLVKARKGGAKDRQYQIANNKGRINGWVSRAAIYGQAVRIGSVGG